jgi:8-oxo-dGTP pyrophosphatase MutT (NUDIX family)
MTEPEAAVAILHASGPLEDSVLLIRRSEREADSWSGHWSFPGGRRNSDDRDLLDTALRELEEECSIRLAREDMDRAFPHMLARRKVRPFIVVAPFLFRIENQLVAVPDPREAVEARWIPLETITDPRQHSLRPVPNWSRDMLFPAIDLNGIPLWGFTYRLLTIWLDLTAAHSSSHLNAFQFAASVLHFLLSSGMSLRHGWADPEIGRQANGEQVVKVAAVNGQIPATAVLDHFSRSMCSVPLVNCLEVRPNYIRVVGLEFEEYLIQASQVSA